MPKLSSSSQIPFSGMSDMLLNSSIRLFQLLRCFSLRISIRFFWKSALLLFRMFSYFTKFLMMFFSSSAVNIGILKSVCHHSEFWRCLGAVFIVSHLLSSCDLLYLWLRDGHYIKNCVCRSNLRPKMIIMPVEKVLICFC